MSDKTWKTPSIKAIFTEELLSDKEALTAVVADLEKEAVIKLILAFRNLREELEIEDA